MLGTLRFAHLPANSFLALLPLEDDTVKCFPGHLEIGLRLSTHVARAKLAAESVIGGGCVICIGAGYEKVITSAGNSYEPPTMLGIFVFTKDASEDACNSYSAAVEVWARYWSSLRKAQVKVHMCTIYARCELLAAGIVVVTKVERNHTEMTVRTVFVNVGRGNEATADARNLYEAALGTGKPDIEVWNRERKYGAGTTIRNRWRKNEAVADARNLYEAAIGTGKLDIKATSASIESLGHVGSGTQTQTTERLSLTRGTILW
ncbi:hypothetical protein B0H13DRAFT_1854936 [Mycena leptocephala]|nr:hypothetical protein B0H13DRAFT_1854936 [Mycena leptocephala]